MSKSENKKIVINMCPKDVTTAWRLPITEFAIPIANHGQSGPVQTKVFLPGSNNLHHWFREAAKKKSSTNGQAFKKGGGGG